MHTGTYYSALHITEVTTIHTASFSLLRAVSCGYAHKYKHMHTQIKLTHIFHTPTRSLSLSYTYTFVFTFPLNYTHALFKTGPFLLFLSHLLSTPLQKIASLSIFVSETHTYMHRSHRLPARSLASIVFILPLHTQPYQYRQSVQGSRTAPFSVSYLTGHGRPPLGQSHAWSVYDNKVRTVLWCYFITRIVIHDE